MKCAKWNRVILNPEGKMFLRILTRKRYLSFCCILSFLTLPPTLARLGEVDVLNWNNSYKWYGYYVTGSWTIQLEMSYQCFLCLQDPHLKIQKACHKFLSFFSFLGAKHPIYPDTQQIKLKKKAKDVLSFYIKIYIWNIDGYYKYLW